MGYGINEPSTLNKDNYTQKSNWENYWENQEIAPYERLFFEEYFKYLPGKGKLIEIGGFPGKFAGYFKKKFDYDVTILDYVMIPEIVRKVEKSYGLNEGSINMIKADFFEYNDPKRYDIVTSVGFIEHFADTALVLKKHIEFLNENGILLVTIPNFTGVNGLVQKYFDRKNYMMHNIQSMDIKILKQIIKTLGLRNFKIQFHGKPTIWLEADAPVRPIIRKILILAGKVIKRIPFRRNWLLAPHIVIIAHK